jgi:hypothetical protein
MWDEIVRQTRHYSSAILTGLDGGGHPFSLRVQPRLDSAAEVVHLTLPPGVEIQPGPASLLYHSLNEQLWNLRSVLLRGRLEADNGQWCFRPVRLVPGMDATNPLAMWRFMMQARRAAKRFLAARGLARPVIPWATINRVKARAKHARH